MCWFLNSTESTHKGLSPNHTRRLIPWLSKAIILPKTGTSCHSHYIISLHKSFYSKWVWTIIRVQDTFLYLDISYIKVYTNNTITKNFPWNSLMHNIPHAISSIIISCQCLTNPFVFHFIPSKSISHETYTITITDSCL